MNSHGIPNLAVVSPGLWRGGQPTAAGWQYLHAQGVTNVIKLNEPFEAEDTEAQALGMTIYRAPVNVRQQLGLEAIPPGRFEDVLAVMPKQGTYIHCQHGQDRTGLFVALYRTHFENWPREQAEAEMLALGFHKSLLGLWREWEVYQ